MRKHRFRKTSKGYFYYWALWKTGTAKYPGQDLNIWIGPFETLDKAYKSKIRNS